jgi:hypothetical protein
MAAYRRGIMPKNKQLSKARAGKPFETGRTVKLRKVTAARSAGDMEPETGTGQRKGDAFYELFKVRPEETENKYVYDLGNGQWNIPKLRTLLEDILRKQQVVNDFEVETEFPNLGRRAMRLSARSYSEDARGKKPILLAIKDITA